MSHLKMSGASKARPKSAGRGRSIARPRTRLAAALRKLGAALARDPQEFGAQARQFAARFRGYSPLNRALIHFQRPEATFLKGRKQWEQMGRRVRPGAHAVQILAPGLRPGEWAPPRGFRSVDLFDLSDTDGPPFSPPCSVHLATGHDLVPQRLRDLEEWVVGSRLTLRYETPVVNEMVDGATNGLTIWIRPDLGPGERLAVLAHEVAHAKLHFRVSQRGMIRFIDERDREASRDEKELEAELTAFLLLELFGIDCSQGSAIYLNSWKASARKIRDHAERCFVAACTILRACELKRYRSLVEEEPKPPYVPWPAMR